MSHRLLHRTTAVPAAMALTAALAVAMPPGENASADSKSYTNACRNSVVPANWDQIGAVNTMTAPATVPAGSKFNLTGISLQLAVPGTVFVTGYNFGLLPKGTSTVPADVYEVIDATNTVEGSQQTNVVSASLSVTINDPDNTPGTGDESASDATGTASFANLTWTAKSGVINFSEHDDQALTGIDGGGIVAVAHVSVIDAAFHCTSGTVQNPGNPVPPAVVTFTKSPVVATTRTAAPTNATALALKKASAKVRRGAIVRFPGRLFDATAKAYLNGQTVVLQRRSKSTAPWSTVSSKLTKTMRGKNGSVVFAVRAKRSFYYDLYFAGTSKYAPSRSKVVRIRVR